jgi:phosphoglycerate dehydrogenase-like enzyme
MSGSSSASSSSASARITILPSGTRDWICDAARAGGAELVDIAEADGLVWTQSDGAEELAALLAENPQIRWVQLPWAGVEPFAEAGVMTDGRTWTCGKGVYSKPVAEHALALALAGMKDLPRYANARSWGEQAGISLMEGRVTIFGGGGITRELVGLLQPLGCEITVVRRHPEPMDGVDRVLAFEHRYEALRGADVVFLALALTEETRGVITAVELELMEPHAWLVNVARGPHVDTEDLVIALRGDVIGGAALDVTDPEPLPDGHPLWELPNCLITPHTANTEDMAVGLLSARITENVRRFAAGEPLEGLVDPALGY